MKNNLKLFLSLKFKGEPPKFNISPSPVQLSDTKYLLEFDPNQIFKFSVNVIDGVVGSALIIDQITIGQTTLNNIDSFGVYNTTNGARKTNGYMDTIGSYTFKIRYNPLSHNYLHFLLDSTK